MLEIGKNRRKLVPLEQEERIDPAHHVGQIVDPCKALVEDIVRLLEKKSYEPVADLCREIVKLLPMGKFAQPGQDEGALGALDGMGVTLWNQSIGLQSDDAVALIVALCTFHSAEQFCPAEANHPSVRDAAYRLIHVGNDAVSEFRILLKKLTMATKTARAYHKAQELELAKESFGPAQRALEALQKVKSRMSFQEEILFTAAQVTYLEQRADFAFSLSEFSVAGFFMKQALQSLQEALKEVGDKEEIKVMLGRHAANLLKTLLHFGQDCISRQVFADAISWLKDAFSLNSMVDADETLHKICHAGVTSFDIYRALAVAHLHVPGFDHLKQAENAVNLALEQRGGDVVALATRLEICAAREDRNMAEDVEALMSLARDAHMESQKDVDIAIGCMHRLVDRFPRPSLVDACVKMFVNLLDSGYGQFSEKIVATACHFASNLEGVDSAIVSDLIAKLRELFSEMRRFNAPLSDENRQISQLVMWEAADALFQNDMPLEALKYYEASTALLGPNDDVNKTVLQRKILLCLTVAKQTDVAKEIVTGLDAKDAMTCFFGFQIAMDEGDLESCIAWISKAGDLDGQDVVATLNTMCHVAIKRQEKLAVKACLDSVLKWHNRRGIALGPQSLVIFRCQLKLERLDPEGLGAETLQRLQMVKTILDQNDVPLEEVEWFFTTCWNSGLKASETDDKQLTSALFKFAYQFSVKAMEHVDFAKSSLGDRADVRLHQCIALLIACTAQMDVSRQLVGEYHDLWTAVLTDVECALGILQEYRGNDMVDTVRLFMQFTALKFECLLQLKNWDSVKKLAIEVCDLAADSKMLERFAHLVICDESCPSGVQFAVIRSALKVAMRVENLPPLRFAQWFRAMLVSSEIMSPLTNSQTSALISNKNAALPIMKDMVQMLDSIEYPQSELTWLVTTTFNIANTCFSLEDTHGAVEWG